VFASFLIKGWSAVVVLMMVPLTLHCLGAYKNGVWLTISSMLVWIDQMDIGLGNGLRNSLATHVARNDMELARKMVSSTMAMLACLMIPILLSLLLLIWQTNVFTFLNVSPDIIPELRVALLSAVILVCATFVLKFIGNVYMGMQLPAVSNLLIALGQTIALIGTALLYYSHQASFWLIIIVNTAAPLLVYLLAFPYTFYWRFPQLRPSLKLVNLRSAIDLANLGVKFFWLQLAGIIQFMTSNILISKFFSPEMVTPYQIAYRYLSLVIVAFTVVCMPFWTATTDAFQRSDMAWIHQASKRMNLFTGLMTLALAVMTIVAPWVYDIWIGDSTHVPSYMTVLMALYIFLIMLSMRYSYFLNGIGALRLQLYMTVSAILFIPLAWMVSCYTHQIMWFMIVMCLCNVPGVLANIIQFNKILKGTAKGIWRI
jgi:O-antigen/teichoic acid export membrane protein